MRRVLWSALVGGVLAVAAAGPVRAQVVGGVVQSYQTTSIYGAPGHYGVSFGVPSYGLTRTYTAYSSPYGLGYGYGYPPYSYLPGRYGVGLWRPGFVAPGYVFGESSYRTFPVPFRPLVPSVGPPLGYYAPGFGPPAFFGW
jgi:hypothetical protein